MFMTRRRRYSILDKSRLKSFYSSYLDKGDTLSDDFSSFSDDLLRHSEDADSETSFQAGAATHPLKDPPKKRNCCGFSIHTPNSSRFATCYHSRILYKFPFLIEMFYWIITYLFYRLTATFADIIFNTSIIEVSQAHGLTLLEIEQFSFLSPLFPCREIDLQTWFIADHQILLACLNHFYALIHIPGTVGFIAWYYYVAPSHSNFAAVRRTLTLTNLFAFTIFTLYPTMPPRMLPMEFGFFDSVRDGKAASVWMMGKFVNTLAAMPSMHFGYASVIGVTLLYHSGAFCWREQLEAGKQKKNRFWKTFYVLLGLLYPALILLAIVATANHYWLDALVAACVSCLAYVCNQVFVLFLPLEDLLLWCLRLEKPIPSTGEKVRQQERR